MLNYSDNYTSHDKNDIFELAALSLIGDRKEQQDRIGYSLKEDAGIAVICDGMGGHQGGQLASTVAVENLIDAYQSFAADEEPRKFLLETVDSLDRLIAQFKNADGSKMEAGSTLSAVMIQQQQLHWVSVGDSRIYVCRDGELVRITQDHTYKMVLERRLSDGSISKETYSREMKRGNVLVSFLGIDGLLYVESNASPLTLLSGDIVLVVSDGIYKFLLDDEICRILQCNDTAIAVVEALFSALQNKTIGQRKRKDNVSAVVIRMK